MAFVSVTEVSIPDGATNAIWLNDATVKKAAASANNGAPNANALIYFQDNSFIAVTQTLAELETILI